MKITAIRRIDDLGTSFLWDRKQQCWVTEGVATAHYYLQRCSYKNHAGANIAANILYRKGELGQPGDKGAAWGDLHVRVKQC